MLSGSVQPCNEVLGLLCLLSHTSGPAQVPSHPRQSSPPSSAPGPGGGVAPEWKLPAKAGLCVPGPFSPPPSTFIRSLIFGISDG